ncbi:MAG: DUF5681 domain-containing protein [Rubrivivax sp.]
MTKWTPPKPWKPGQSGNPAGRKPGAGKVAALRESIAKHVPEIVAKLVERALAGDAQAARLLIERVIPPVKAVELPAPIALPADGSLADQGRAVLGAAGLGALAPGQAAQLLAGLGALARLVETDELAARVAALELKHEKP